MKSFKSITLTAPLRDVRPAGGSALSDAAASQRALEQAAYERGRRDMEKLMGEQLLQQRAEILEIHRGVVESLRNAVPHLIRETEGVLIDLALQAAQKVVAGIPINAKTVEAVVREALRQVEDTADITIQLHPDDLALLRKQKSPILEGLPETGPLRFAPSAEVTRGGCTIRTRFGVVDARRETKIEQLRQSLTA
jgi:flagellar assembly protein FliH